jgi:hypothetical protein
VDAVAEQLVGDQAGGDREGDDEDGNEQRVGAELCEDRGFARTLPAPLSRRPA